ncbi:MAG: Uncharacterised protein [Methanobacteriota archaeon]|nr:MAG: Uncharacterised protein [Euryarchaeota archaeon]
MHSVQNRLTLGGERTYGAYVANSSGSGPSSDAFAIF